MLKLIDDISEVVYVCDVETYELLYLNKVAKSLFNVESYEGKKCYQVLHGLDKPCRFCTNDILQKGNTESWKFYHEKLKTHFHLKDRLIDWDGRKAHMGVAFPISELANEKNLLTNALNAEKMLMQCVLHLYDEKDLKNSLDLILKELGTTLQAKRTFIFEVKKGKLTTSYEWCSPGAKPRMLAHRNLPFSLIDSWMPAFQKGECVAINDVNSAIANELLPPIFISADINSLVVAPLEKEGQLVGFIGLENIATHVVHNIVPLLSTLRYFIMSTMRHIEDDNRLYSLSYEDTLTGLYNRNRYMKDIEKVESCCNSLGVAYLDLNGLKEINDTQGHKAGDVAIKKCANILRQIFPNADHYRIGGDEFVIMQSSVSKELFYKRFSALRKYFDSHSVYKVAIGSAWSNPPLDVHQMIHLADKEMYEDKRRFYRFMQNDRRQSSTQEKEPSSIKDHSQLISNMRISIAEFMMQGSLRMTWANEYFYNLLGYDKEEFSQHFDTCEGTIFLGDSEQYHRFSEVVKEAFQDGKSNFGLLLRLEKRNKELLWVHAIGTFIESHQNGFPVFYIVFSDVDETVRLQKEQLVTYDNLPGFVAKIKHTPKGLKLLYGNEQFSAFFGKKRPGTHNELLDINVKQNVLVLNDFYNDFRNGENVSFEILATDVNAQHASFQVHGSCIDWDDDNPIYLVVFIDVSIRSEQRKQLEILAFLDPITGGRNRAKFEMDAGGLINLAPKSMYVFVSLDIQKFKLVNDLFGIHAGDLTLRFVYTEILSHLHQDELVARVSSDTFSILMKNDSQSVIMSRILAMTEAVNEYNDYAQYKYVLNFAVGIYEIDDSSLDMTQLQDRATVARKQAKKTTSSSFCLFKFYSPEDRQRLQREKEIENKMKVALNNREFVVYLQPKQDLKTKQIAGAEALVRWQDSQYGLIPPNNFIPQFEQNGFIIQLDLYVFEETCRLIRSWIDEGITPIPISINMSRAHLIDHHFLDRYEDIRKHYAVPAQYLEIELTETLVFNNPELLSSIIDNIHAHGFLCSMDDFGSGYSSLSALKDIHVDTLKIDRSFFVNESMETPWDRHVVQVIIDLAKHLDMKVVAEGIETQEQADFLEEAGCDMLQGFLYSRPIPFKSFRKYLPEKK